MQYIKLITILAIVSALQACAGTQPNDIFNSTEDDEPTGQGLFSNEQGQIVIYTETGNDAKSE